MHSGKRVEVEEGLEAQELEELALLVPALEQELKELGRLRRQAAQRPHPKVLVQEGSRGLVPFNLAPFNPAPFNLAQFHAASLARFRLVRTSVEMPRPALKPTRLAVPQTIRRLLVLGPERIAELQRQVIKLARRKPVLRPAPTGHFLLALPPQIFQELLLVRQRRQTPLLVMQRSTLKATPIMV